jgi:hypothetical protein
MKILLKRGLWSHKTGHISNTIYDRKLKFGTQVKDFITYLTTIICYYSRSMKPILYINKNLYLRVCYILKNVLPKMGFSPFSLSVQAGKKGG